MDNKSDTELREIRKLRRERLNEENISRQQLQEQMDIFQQQRDLFLRRQRQARETSAAETRSTALTEGLENNGDRQETSTASIGVEQRSCMSDSRAEQCKALMLKEEEIIFQVCTVCLIADQCKAQMSAKGERVSLEAIICQMIG